MATKSGAKPVLLHVRNAVSGQWKPWDGAVELGEISLGEVTANAGTDLNTSLLALEAGGNLAAIKAKTDNIPALGQAVAASSLPVTMASNQGDIKITLDSESVAVTNAGITTLAGAVAGTEMQVDVLTLPAVTATDLDIRELTSADVVTVTGGAGQTADVKITLDSESVAVTGTFWQATQPVSLASVPSHAVTNAGTFAVQVDGDALTSLQLIDDSVYVDDADWADNTSKHLLVGGVYQSAPHTVTDGDVTPFLTDANGKLIISGTVTANLSTTDNTVLDNIDTNTGNAATSLAILDDWDDSNYCNVNINVAGTDVAANAGVNTAQTLRVTIATDDEVNNSLASIDGKITACNTGAVTVSAMPTTTVTATNLDIRDIDSATDDITIYGDVGVVDQIDLANSNPLAVAIVDADGTQITSFGGGTQYTEGDTDATITGTAMLWEDAANTLVTVNSTKPLPVDLGTNNDVTLATLPDTAGGDLATISGDTTSIDGKITACNTGAVVISSGTVTTITNAVAVTNADITSCKTALELLDNSVDGNYLNTNMNIAGTDVVGGAGVVAAGVQRITLASDDPAVVDLAAIEVLLGTIDTDTGNIATSLGNMDNSVDGNYLNVNLNVAGTDVAANAGVLTAQTLRVTIATDDECNNYLGTIDADTSALFGCVGGTELQVDIVGSLPAGTNGIGKLTANSGVDIGDVDVTSIVPGTGATNLGKAEDAAHSSGDVGVMVLAVRDDDPVAAVSGTAGDYTPLHLDNKGVLWTRSLPDDTDMANAGTTHVKKYYTSAGAVTDGIVWSPAAGKRWHITDIFLNVSAAATVTIEDDLAAGDSVVWKAELAANSGWSHSFTTPLFSGEDAADLIVTTSAGNIYVTCVGYEI
jgi:hypothetical protein